MEIFLGPNTNIIPSRFSSKMSGKEAMRLPLLYLLVLQLPFLSLWISIIKGQFEPSYPYFLIAYFLICSFFIWLIIGFRKIQFGFDDDGIFMKKHIGFVKIPWEKIESIELIREFKEFSEIDMFPINDLFQRNRFLYRFKGNNLKFTVSQYYSESNKFGYWVSQKSKKTIQSKKWSVIDWVVDNNI